MNITDPNRIYKLEEMASGDVIFSATGVTDGNMLSGVKFARDYIETETLVMRSSSKTIRRIIARHQNKNKF